MILSLLQGWPELIDGFGDLSVFPQICCIVDIHGASKTKPSTRPPMDQQRE